jgi:hypothetical protein
VKLLVVVHYGDRCILCVAGELAVTGNLDLGKRVLQGSKTTEVFFLAAHFTSVIEGNRCHRVDDDLIGVRNVDLHSSGCAEFAIRSRRRGTDRVVATVGLILDMTERHLPTAALAITGRATSEITPAATRTQVRTEALSIRRFCLT